MYPDRLDAVVAAAHAVGATSATHNLGGVHHDAHHATMCVQPYRPARLPTASWEQILSGHLR